MVLSQQFSRKLGHDVTGIDISKDMLVAAEKYTNEQKVKVQLYEAWASETPFGDNEFDVVVNRVVFWTLPDPSKAIKEWIRVAKSGGRIIIIEWEGIGGVRKLFLQIIQAMRAVRRGEKIIESQHSYSKSTWEKLPFGPMNKRLRVEQWPQYLSCFQVEQIKVKDISYVDQAENKAFSVEWLIKYFLPRRLMITCKVKK